MGRAARGEREVKMSFIVGVAFSGGGVYIIPELWFYRLEDLIA